uniref:HTH_Tnp_Tc3_1 domain-containing protein n=1 Tax=Panagrellus redivivus TaxID=6233 RepID=A0A7E4W794_PANRE
MIGNGRQMRAESVGVCLGISDKEQMLLTGINNTANGRLPLGPNKIRRRSTRRRLSQVQKAINFGEWANKRFARAWE